jgi:hypothetical protein
VLADCTSTACRSTSSIRSRLTCRLLLREEEKIALPPLSLGALEKRGVTYEAQYIEQALLDFIVTTPMETAVIYDENGDVLAECGQSR